MLEKMNEQLRNDHFVSLVDSYLGDGEGDWDNTERALRSHAKNWDGCISCVFSRKKEPSEYIKTKNIWLSRRCKFGLSQDTCGMHEEFPKGDQNE